MNYIKEVFDKHGISVTDQQAEKLYKYFEMLVEKNKVMNLTAITEYKEVVVKHFLDSAYLLKYVDREKLAGKKMIDIGTGGGFPGIPLKILCPELEILLLDSLNKRILFLDDVIRELKLDKISTIHGRAEEIAKKAEYREQFDYAVSRAVANLNSLSEISLPFVKCNGQFISYKSMKGEEELEDATHAVAILGGSLKNKAKAVVRFTLEEDSAGIEPMERNFIMINKVKSTPKKYPRKPGTPFKEPLK